MWFAAQLDQKILDGIYQRGIWIFNKFESFRFAKGRHVVVFTVLIRKSVKMDGVNVIDTIRQFLRNFLWFLLFLFIQIINTISFIFFFKFIFRTFSWWQPFVI